LSGFTAPGSQAQHEPFVWVGSLEDGEITKRAPSNRKTNLWIIRGAYDGPGGFTSPDFTIEKHLAKIEQDAASAIRDLANTPPSNGVVIAPAIWRFLAWQAARTPGWMELVQKWIDERSFDSDAEVVEPPPPGWEKITHRPRQHRFVDPRTGQFRKTADLDEIGALHKEGWRIVLQRDDHLEMMHIQAWYFQVRFFPRFSWRRLNAPEGEYFVTSDRGVSWIVDGFADTPPTALRHPTAVIVAPLTKRLALIGRYEDGSLEITARNVNRLVAFASSKWIAGPTRFVVERAMQDRADSIEPLPH
jgi:hypothetical protein